MVVKTVTILCSALCFRTERPGEVVAEGFAEELHLCWDLERLYVPVSLHQLPPLLVLQYRSSILFSQSVQSTNYPPEYN